MIKNNSRGVLLTYVTRSKICYSTSRSCCDNLALKSLNLDGRNRKVKGQSEIEVKPELDQLCGRDLFYTGNSISGQFHKKIRINVCPLGRFFHETGP